MHQNFVVCSGFDFYLFIVNMKKMLSTLCYVPADVLFMCLFVKENLRMIN